MIDFFRDERLQQSQRNNGESFYIAHIQAIYEMRAWILKLEHGKTY
jgi:hypothetical protein